MLYVECGPIIEIHYTGISNVVIELVKRFRKQTDYEVEYVIDARRVPPEVVDICVEQNSGQHLTDTLPGLPQFSLDDPKPGDFVLYTNTRPPVKSRAKEAMIIYDFSTLLTPEVHAQPTLDHHNNNICKQIELSDYFFCISESTAIDLQAIFGVEDERIKVAYIGAKHDEPEDQLDELMSGGFEPYFLMLGTIEPRKNIEFVLDYLVHNPDILEAHRMVFAGRYGWGKTFEEQIADHGLQHFVQNGRIVYLNYVSNQLKGMLLKNASAVIYPSIYEGFGMPVLEAMKVSTPVLASCATSISEIVDDCGFLFDPYELHSFDRALFEFNNQVSNGRIKDVVYRATQRALLFDFDDCFKIYHDSILEVMNGN